MGCTGNAISVEICNAQSTINFKHFKCLMRKVQQKTTYKYHFIKVGANNRTLNFLKIHQIFDPPPTPKRKPKNPTLRLLSHFSWTCGPPSWSWPFCGVSTCYHFMMKMKRWDMHPQRLGLGESDQFDQSDLLDSHMSGKLRILSRFPEIRILHSIKIPFSPTSIMKFL